jgi:hypothetical protein
LLVGIVKATVIVREDVETEFMVGDVGLLAGVTSDAATTAVLEPTVLTVFKFTVYPVPFMSPVILNGLEVVAT